MVKDNVWLGNMETHFWTRRRRFAKNIFSEALDSRTTSDEREGDIVQQVLADVVLSALPKFNYTRRRIFMTTGVHIYPAHQYKAF